MTETSTLSAPCILTLHQQSLVGSYSAAIDAGRVPSAVSLLGMVREFFAEEAGASWQCVPGLEPWNENAGALERGGGTLVRR